MPSTRTQRRRQRDELESQFDTLDTLSTAVLPPTYTVTLASARPVDLDKTEKARVYIKGQECLHDAVRRVRDKEGDLRELVRARKRYRRLDQSEGYKLDKEVLWYTASLRYPCSCDLQSLQRAFTLRVPPPAAQDLSTLPDLTDSSERVRLGLDLPVWSTSNIDYVDLEPELSNLKEFEVDWKGSSGSIWRLSQGAGRFCDAFEQEGADLSFEAIKESLATRRIRKGKYKAVDGPVTLAPILGTVDTSDLPSPNPMVEDRVVQARHTAEKEWEEESRRRKQLWRGLIGKDSGYGQFWINLARPHSYSSLGASSDRKCPPDYNLFRNYRTSSHPFHPDLRHYAKRNPFGRVYWLVPIHGPVVVPTLNDNADSRKDGKEADVPLPSTALYSSSQSVHPASMAARPAPAHWSPALLDHFLRSFLLPLRQSRLYSLSFAFSGPKPDPFIALPSPLPLASHRHISKQKTMSTSHQTSSPVRVECGDHLRIYCDAQEALSLRTWLHGVKVDPNSVDLDAKATEDQPYRLFDKVRLCLIGEMGEVLIVA